jgi:hypothetical protein
MARRLALRKGAKRPIAIPPLWKARVLARDVIPAPLYRLPAQEYSLVAHDPETGQRINTSQCGNQPYRHETLSWLRHITSGIRHLDVPWSIECSRVHPAWEQLDAESFAQFRPCEVKEQHRNRLLPDRYFLFSSP